MQSKLKPLVVAEDIGPQDGELENNEKYLRPQAALRNLSFEVHSQLLISIDDVLIHLPQHLNSLKSCNCL